MSPFTALFEGLHSAWIDELIERFPDPKPELGMPVRYSGLTPPLEPSALSCVLRADVELSERVGAVFLALTAEAEKKLGVGADALWTAMLTRAESEFARRSIQPKFLATESHFVNSWQKKAVKNMSRLVWVPVSLNGALCFLGLAA